MRSIEEQRAASRIESCQSPHMRGQQRTPTRLNSVAPAFYKQPEASGQERRQRLPNSVRNPVGLWTYFLFLFRYLQNSKAPKVFSSCSGHLPEWKLFTRRAPLSSALVSLIHLATIALFQRCTKTG